MYARLGGEGTLYVFKIQNGFHIVSASTTPKGNIQENTTNGYSVCSFNDAISAVDTMSPSTIALSIVQLTRGLLFTRFAMNCDTSLVLIIGPIYDYTFLVCFQRHGSRVAEY